MRALLAGLLLVIAIPSQAQSNVLVEGYTAMRLGNFERAFTLFDQAAKEGSNEARYQLGKLYLSGRGVARDEAAARSLLQQAAESGDAGAQFTLGLLLLDEAGQGEQARAWLKQAAAQNHQQAVAELGRLAQREVAQSPAIDDSSMQIHWQQASVNCRVEELTELLHAGFTINWLDDYQRNALYYLVACANFEGAALLLSRGIDANNLDKFGETALSLAVKQDAPAMAELLVDAGADGTQVQRGSTLLHLVASSASPTMLSTLLRAKPPLDTLDSAGKTALDIAMLKQDKAAQRLLIEAGATATANSRQMVTGDPWERARQAALQDQADILATLLDGQGKALLMREDEQHRTLFMYATQANATAVVSLLVERGAAIGQRNSTGETALMLTVRTGNTEALQQLLSAGADMLSQDAKGRDAITLALGEANNDAVARLLLEQFPRSGLPHELANRYLLQASRASARSSINWLVDHGARAGAADNSGRTAIWYAAANCDLVTLDYLLEHSKSPDHKDANGYTPLHIAAANGCPQEAEALLASNADIEAKTEHGNTPLILAVQYRRENTALMLLQKDATVSVQNDRGDTALIRAVSSGSERVVSALLEQGADAYSRNNFGDSALSLAERTAPPLAKLIEDRRGLVF